LINPLSRAKRIALWASSHRMITAVAGFWILVAGLVWAFPPLFVTINPTIWVLTQLVTVYTFISLVFYVALYGTRFRWADYRGGQLIFSLTFSLSGVMLLVMTAFFINPVSGFAWYEMPPETFHWRPSGRLAIYLGVAASITSMNRELLMRLAQRQPIELSVPVRDESRR